jgi:signal transduction histidine kinase
VHIARDVTQYKQMEQQLIMTDRLASVGELVSGIAHELNNPLTSVIGFSELLREADIPLEIKEDLDTISSEAGRAADIVRNLLTFARKHDPVRQASQINNIIDDVLKLRAYEHKVNNISVRKNLANDLPEIMVDYFQIQQVFLNIVVNAEQAMLEAHKSGTLSITTRRFEDIVRVSFTDDGPGISQKDTNKIFNPFFTTKEVGKGTGLGLSICHGVVSAHSGQIYVKSKPGRGATFIIELPIYV